MRRHPLAVKKPRFGQRKCTDASRRHPARYVESLSKVCQHAFGRPEGWLRAAADNDRVEDGIPERLGLDHEPGR